MRHGTSATPNASGEHHRDRVGRPVGADRVAGSIERRGPRRRPEPRRGQLVAERAGEQQRVRRLAGHQRQQHVDQVLGQGHGPPGPFRLRRAHASQALRDDLEQALAHHLPGRVQLNGHPVHRLPGTLNISIDGAAGHAVLAAWADLAASTGSACHSGNHTASPVLTAMDLSTERGLSALRLTLGRWTTPADVVHAADALARRPCFRPISTA